jgi:hypothetical protein
MSTSRTVHSTILSAAMLLGLGGTVGGLSGCAHEHKLTSAELPPAVRTTLDRETAGGQVTELERETKGGKVTYSADATINGKKYDIDIAEDGTLIGKKPE